MLPCSVGFAHVSQCLVRISRLPKCLRKSPSSSARYTIPATNGLTLISPSLPPKWAIQSRITEIAQSRHIPKASNATNHTETSCHRAPESAESVDPTCSTSIARKRHAIRFQSRSAKPFSPQQRFEVSRSTQRHVPRILSHVRSKARIPSCLPKRQSATRSIAKYLNPARPRMIWLGSRAKRENIAKLDYEQAHSHRYLDDLDTCWSKRFMRLEEGQALNVWKTMNIQQFVQKYVGIRMGRETFHRLWDRLPELYRLNRWQDVMLWCLQNHPEKALNLLLLTSQSQTFKPPRYMVQDCLHSIARHFLFTTQKAKPSAVDAIWYTAIKIVDRGSAEDLRSLFIFQDAIQLLLKHCRDTQALSLYEKLDVNQIEIPVNTMLHFLKRFGKMAKLDICIKLLERICSNASVKILGSKQLLSGCVSLLRTHWGLGEPYRIQSVLMSRMLEMGVRPDTHMYNIILLNMIEGYDFNTAWQTYDMLQENSHFKDIITYHILAKGAGLSRNPNVLQTVLEENPNTQDIYLMSQVLGAISEMSPGHEFSAMLEYYKQHLDLRPLQELGLCGAEAVSSQCLEHHGKWPNEYILGRMILACNKCHDSPSELIQRYQTFNNLVRQGHPLIAPLARYDYVANSFLLALGQRRQTLEYCTTVVKDMLSPSPSTDSILHSSPTVQTWSILMRSYMRHGQKLAAQKVLAMMRERDLQPNIVTWTTLIHGYAASQDTKGTIGALRQMEREGFEFNSWTMKALGMHKDRDTLLAKLKSSLNEDVADEPEEDVSLDNANGVQGYLADYSRRRR